MKDLMRNYALEFVSPNTLEGVWSDDTTQWAPKELEVEGVGVQIEEIDEEEEVEVEELVEVEDEGVDEEEEEGAK